MCNEFANYEGYRDWVEGFSHTKLKILKPGPESAPNWLPEPSIRTTDLAPIIRPFDDGLELLRLPWGLKPDKPKGRPVINMRSEGRQFGRGRCLIPVSCFFEFTGTTYPKTRWKIDMADGSWFMFAGIIGHNHKDDHEVEEAFTLLTSDPSPEIAEVHDRQPVIVLQDQWEAWLDPETPSSEILKPTPAGLLKVEESPRA